MERAELKVQLCVLLGTASRRGALRVLVGSALSRALSFGVTSTAAKKRKKKKVKICHKGRTIRVPKSARQRHLRHGDNRGACVTRADAACPGFGSGGLSIIGDARLAQSFTALESAWLVAAEVLIGNVAGASGDWELRLSPVEPGGAPTNTVLASATIPDGSVPVGSAATVNATFRTPVPVVAGTDYALVLTRPGSTQFSWFGHSTNACPGAAWISLDQTGPFSFTGSPADFIFETFVSS